MKNLNQVNENNNLSKISSLRLELNELRLGLDTPDDNTRMQSRLSVYRLVSALKILQPDLFEIISIPNLSAYMQPASLSFFKPYPNVLLDELDLYFATLFDEPVQPTTISSEDFSSTTGEIQGQPIETPAEPILIAETKISVVRVIEDPKPALITKILAIAETVPRPYFELYMNGRNLESLSVTRLQKILADLPVLITLVVDFPMHEHLDLVVSTEPLSEIKVGIAKAVEQIIVPLLLESREAYLDQIKIVFRTMMYSVDTSSTYNSARVIAGFDFLNLYKSTFAKVTKLIQISKLLNFSIELPKVLQKDISEQDLFDIYEQMLADCLIAKHKDKSPSQVRKALKTVVNRKPRKDHVDKIFKIILDSKSLQIYQTAMKDFHDYLILFEDVK